MSELTKEEIQLETETVKSQLELLNVKFHHNASLKTLQGLLADATKPTESEQEATVASAGIKECAERALKLFRCTISANDPGKRQLKGEFITTGNTILGHKTYFVPYNCVAAEDFVLPQIVIDALRDRRFLSKTEDMVSDVHSRSFYMAPTFTVGILGEV